MSRRNKLGSTPSGRDSTNAALETLRKAKLEIPKLKARILLVSEAGWSVKRLARFEASL